MKFVYFLQQVRHKLPRLLNASDFRGAVNFTPPFKPENTNLVRYLLDHGARTDLRDASGRTPFDVANGVHVPPLSLGAEGANIPDPNAKANVEAVPAAPALAGGRNRRGVFMQIQVGPGGDDVAISDSMNLLAAGNLCTGHTTRPALPAYLGNRLLPLQSHPH